MNSSTALRTATLLALILLGSWAASPGGAEEPAAPASGPHGLEFVRVEPGRFVMGADLDPGFVTAERAIFIQDEFPPRQVTPRPWIRSGLRRRMPTS